jgi:hypothetical protein
MLTRQSVRLDRMACYAPCYALRNELPDIIVLSKLTIVAASFGRGYKSRKETIRVKIALLMSCIASGGAAFNPPKHKHKYITSNKLHRKLLIGL